MLLSKDPMEATLLDHLAKVTEGRQWIWVFQPSEGTWTEQHMQQVLRHLKARKGLVEKIELECLQVTPMEGRAVLEIHGVQHISTYCYSESPSIVPSRWVQRVMHLSERLPEEFPLPVLSKVVEEIDVAAEDTKAWSAQRKQYRLQREFSYENEKVIYRVRCVRESDESISMVASGVTAAPVSYEFDMVMKSVDGATEAVTEAVSMIQMLTDNEVILSKAEQDKVLVEYDELVSKIVQIRRRNGEKDPHYFLTPKPITLEQHNLIEPGPETYGVTSIWNGYAVTDKADGERMLLYVSKEGKCYVINNVFQVFDVGLVARSEQLHQTLMDGEYIRVTDRKDGKDMDMFAVFDIYIVEGKSVMNLPLIHKTQKSRYGLIQNLCDIKLWDAKNTQIELRYKEHVAADGDDMRDACRALLQGGKDLPYHIDGLIFTPADLSVFGYYPGKPVPIPDNVRWDRVLKWKPEEQNTIDFLVQKGTDVFDPLSQKVYREFKLYTGYNANQWEPITPIEGIRLRYDKAYAASKRAMGDVYRAKLFRPVSYYESGVDIALVPVVAGACVAEDGSLVDGDMIVEFAYNPDPSIPVSKRWKPLRVRHDKTRIFTTTGKLSKTANDLTVASSIWRSIHKPVTKEMLIGGVPVHGSAAPDTMEERLLGTDDVYYAREIPRQHMLSVAMLNFHNQGIKKMLYQRSRQKDALLELACGMAGDLPRWRDGEYKFVLGVDLVKDNITNPRDGSYARMLRQRYVIKQMVGGMEKTFIPNIVFVVGDCAKPLENGAAAEGLDEESRTLLRVIYKNQGGNQSYYEYIRGRASKGFSVVSCMFAIHYFFKTEESLDGFFRNVSHNLRKGGIFIATFMDGDRVHELVSQSPTGVVEGRKLDNKIPVWAIVRRYGDLSDDYGKVVEVFLENTNHLIPEYLVRMNTLVQKARQHGLELEESALFSETFQKLRENVPEDAAKRSHLDEDILALDEDAVQKKFSFLNRWVVFRKL